MDWLRKQFEIVAFFSGIFHKSAGRYLPGEQQDSAPGIDRLELYSEIYPVQLGRHDV